MIYANFASQCLFTREPENHHSREQSLSGLLNWWKLVCQNYPAVPSVSAGFTGVLVNAKKQRMKGLEELFSR